VVVYSGLFAECLDEGTLAASMAAKLALIDGGYVLEACSMDFLSNGGVVTASAFVIASFMMRKLWFLSLPYAAMYGVFRWIYRDVTETIISEMDYKSLRLLYQAGYDLDKAFEYWTGNMERGERYMSLLRPQMKKRWFSSEV